MDTNEYQKDCKFLSELLKSVKRKGHCPRIILIESSGYSWLPRAHGGGGRFPPTETEKIVVEKWCYFPELYKMTKGLEDHRENV